MRAIIALAILLAGCAGSEYSQVPEPTGEWVPANPPAYAPAPSLASHGRAPAEPLPASPASFRSTALRPAP